KGEHPSMSAHHRIFIRPTLLFASIMLVAVWCHASFAQPLPAAPDSNRSPNPRVIVKYIAVARANDRKIATAGETKKLSPADEKKAAIEQAIQDGNEAREANSYEK